MNSPFKYGKVVTGEHFINRANDIKRFQNNISAGINTILISPRRWGKSSLMKQVEYLNKNKKLRFAFIDFFNIRTEEDFLEKYSREIIKCSIINSLKHFLSLFHSQLSFLTLNSVPLPCTRIERSASARSSRSVNTMPPSP